MNPSFLFVVFCVGLLAIYFEFNHPGAVVPGVIGFLAVLLALYAIHFLPFRSMALVMILSSFIIFALEAKYQTHGVLGVAGVVVMTIGALLLIDGPIPEMRVRPWAALSVSIPLGAITIFLMTIALQARRNKVLTGEQGLVGEIGIAQSPLIPDGKVFVHGEIWNAVAATNVDAGSHVVVRKVENLVLHVDSAQAPAVPVSHAV
jgi:membrane-bound serine protease (ClpP class)